MGNTRQPATPLPFQAHIALLRAFVTHRHAVVERIQGLLNAQREPVEDLLNRPLWSRRFEDSFFTLPGIAELHSGPRDQLEHAHWARGFRPRPIPGLHNGLIDPAEMMTRAFYVWQHTRWPGRNGRLRYAHTLFNTYVLGRLTLLSLHVWDAGPSESRERLSQLQAVLDQLWAATPADQPILVRNARWLIALAQSPATDDLGAYFDVAEQVATCTANEDRVDIHDAGVRMAAGHLRSQLRYASMKNGVSLDDARLVSNTRNTNALDIALLIQDLVPLLEAYERAVRDGNGARRLELADAICQGVSPDPELFVNRVELLGAYSMNEHLFIDVDRDGHARYTPMGQRHVQLLQEYRERIERMSEPLLLDCVRFRPVDGGYSPYGALYGFSSNLLEHVVLKASQPDAVARFGLEDVFASGGPDTLAWVRGWRQLPHLPRDVEARFDYPQRFAEEVFDRVEHALRRRVNGDTETGATRTGRLFVLRADTADSDVASMPELPAQYVGSSDQRLVAAGLADPHEASRIASDRREGRCLVSYETPGGWATISKAVLTELLEAGQSVKVTGVPTAAGEALALMCPTLVANP